MPRPKITTNQCELNPVNISAASAMPERSAPTLMELAAKSAIAAIISNHRGIFWPQGAAESAARYHPDARTHKLHATHERPGKECCPQ